MKKTLLFLFIILLVLSIGTVSATNETDTSTSDITNHYNVISENTENNNTIILSNENSQKSMTELENTIKNNKNTTIILNNDYRCTEQDTDLKYGILVDKSIIIDGQGHTIDAHHKMRIFKVANDVMVTFKNINFLNGDLNEDYHGGAILNMNDKTENTIIIDCTFKGNSATYGGAISKCIAINCTFINNHAWKNGGAMQNGNAINCIFTNNTAEFNGGAVWNNGGDITNCIFTNNDAKWLGGAIYNNENMIVKNTTFKNNKAEGGLFQCSGGAIYCGGNVEVDNCTFIGNHAEDYGGAIYANTISLTNNPSYFINNNVDDNQGGAIYTNKFETDVKYAVFINNTVKSNDVSLLTIMQEIKEKSYIIKANMMILNIIGMESTILILTIN